MCPRSTSTDCAMNSRSQHVNTAACTPTIAGSGSPERNRAKETLPKPVTMTTAAITDIALKKRCSALRWVAGEFETRVICCSCSFLDAREKALDGLATRQVQSLGE